MTCSEALSSPFFLATLCAGLIVGGGCKKPELNYPPVAVSGDRLEIPLASVSDGTVHFFSCRLDDNNIDFFVRSDASGQLSAYFDACYSCCKYRRGYFQENGKIICRACRVSFDLAAEEWDFIGACTPVKLKTHVEAQVLVIHRRQLARGSLFF